MASDGGSRQDDGNHESEGSRYDPKTQLFLEELLKEKHQLSTSSYPHAARLLEQEVAKAKQTGLAVRDFRYVDIFREKPIKLVSKVMIPVKEYPKFNFVGKLLGPKGNTLRRLQEETMCKMIILGRGSMKDKNREEELRNGLDPKYSHLSDDLHVEVSSLGSPSMAHSRMSFALKELRRYLIPDANDEISKVQLMEMEYNEMQDGEPNMKQGPPFRGGKRMVNVGSSKAKVLSILEKARNSMDSISYNNKPVPHHIHHHQNNYERSQGPRGGHEGYAKDYESQHYEEESHTGYRGGYRQKMALPSSRFMSRHAPY